jgi:hypothetical protein
MNPTRVLFAAAVAWALLGPAGATASSLRFHGNGVAAPGLDRVKVRVDEVGNADPGPPADIGAGDFTIEFWMKAAASENGAGAVSCGENVAWIEGNIVVDRDRFNQGRKFGVSIAGGKLVFGVSSESASRTLCGSATVLDNAWHHVAVTRHGASGALAIWVDGVLDGSGPGPTGDLSYPDDGVPCSNCCGGGNCNGSDPFLVLGAEKHDAGASYPSYSGFLDELRLSDVRRYTGAFSPSALPFSPDASTMALYHFDEGAGDAIGDSSGHPDGPSDGTRHYGGSPAGPEWAGDSPFGDPGDLDGDGKPNGSDECTVLLASQRFARTKLGLAGIGAGAGAQSVNWKGQFRPSVGSSVSPASDGLHLRIADGAGDLLDIDIPAGLVGASPSTPCDARDGWKVSGAVSLYRNFSGFLDAACTVPASGISQVKIIDQTAAASPRVRFQVRVRGATFAVQSPATRMEASLALAERPSPGVASVQAEEGACGDHVWDPVTFSKPLPFCKAAPASGPPVRLLCRTL